MGNKAYLVLENGKVFCGESFGAAGEVTAEVVFTTGMASYLETLTEKSYFGQIVVQTFPLIGNYGVISSDFEGSVIGPRGYIVKEWCQSPSNFRSEGDLDAFFKARGVVALCGIDTRALTRTLRENGVMNGVITADPASVDLEALKAYRVEKAIESVSVKAVERFENPEKKATVAVLDYGMLKSVRTKLEKFGAEVIVCPFDTTAEQLKELNVDGIVLSDGPGDPTENAQVIENLKAIMALGLPMLGIGMGHEVLALANGFKTDKMKHGHRGANQPVKDEKSGRTYVTSQNHGYAVVSDSVDSALASVDFVNVNDKTCEGLRYKNIPAVSVQFMPDAASGSSDTTFVFEDFFRAMQKA
ncbi:MAG: carbamoyl phosphate synthase small subunit [Clostridia bacterium]|nr:carbamoyl phosphate synthase small subunit [Clostridia bacterium]